ncbi:MAG: 4-demethylwyosine synthase TYW1 [Candidatus Pacearchaeota archaeon]|nr:4-demethylwyosine synthase TYW1 [Candidatus Pacearchaeota archaeon]
MKARDILKSQKSAKKDISDDCQNARSILKAQHYALIGEHSAIQICRWAKKSLIDAGCCYKEKFYGIHSHECCQMSPWIACDNKCLHCWRPIELNSKLNFNKIKKDSPKNIIKSCILNQRKMLSGFKGNKKINIKKWLEAQNPRNFAISLIGEPTLYPKLAELILELKKQKKTSFLVTNGLYPEKLKLLEKRNALPTQLYVSLNSSNKEHYKRWHRSKLKNAWEKFNKTLELMRKLKKKTRTVIRMTLVKDENMKDDMIKDYAKLIKKAQPMFIEVKGFMSIGYSRKRFPYEKMPRHELVKEFSRKLLKFLPKYKLLDEKKESAVVLLGTSKKDMKIKN